MKLSEKELAAIGIAASSEVEKLLLHIKAQDEEIEKQKIMAKEFERVGSVDVRLIEECSELIQAITKCQRFGWDSKYPGTEVSGRNQVLVEIFDVERCIQELRERIFRGEL